MTTRKSYTVEKKLEILQWHEENGSSLHKTSKKFELDRKSLRDWIKKKDVLEMNEFGQNKKKRKIGCGRKPLSEQIDEELFEFFEKEREAGRAISNKLLGSEARKIAVKKGLDFKASAQYIANFKRRYNISMRMGTTDCQKTPEELKEEVTCFLNCVKESRITYDYTDYNIGNMDQTMCRFDVPSNRTNNLKGESTIRITNTGCRKRGFTVALCARASGHKACIFRPAFCILKEPSGKIPSKVLSKLIVPENVRVTATKNGWMHAETFKEWVRKVWGPDEDDVKRLLIIDRAPIHKTAEAASALKETNTNLLLIPPGCTRLLQPADVSWNKAFKSKLQENWEEYIRKEEKTKKGNLKAPSRQDVLRWVSNAWTAVSEELIKKSFKRCGISLRLDGSENGELHLDLARAYCSPPDELETEVLDLILNEDVDDDEDFDGFSDEED